MIIPLLFFFFLFLKPLMKRRGVREGSQLFQNNSVTSCTGVSVSVDVGNMKHHSIWNLSMQYAEKCQHCRSLISCLEWTTQFGIPHNPVITHSSYLLIGLYLGRGLRSQQYFLYLMRLLMSFLCSFQQWVQCSVIQFCVLLNTWALF